MAGFSSWVDSHFNLIQTLSFFGTVWVGILTIRHMAKTQEATNRFTLKQQHDTLWSRVETREDLKRILQPKVDLEFAPVTMAEEEFLNLVFVHFEDGWQLAKQGSVNKLKTLAADQGKFTALPIPYVVWKRTTDTRDPDFVRFVERAIERRGRLANCH